MWNLERVYIRSGLEECGWPTVIDNSKYHKLVGQM